MCMVLLVECRGQIGHWATSGTTNLRGDHAADVGKELAPWLWAVAAGSEVSGRLIPVAPQLHFAVRGSPAVYILFVPRNLSGNLFVRCLR